jgi:hypothetical protein
MTENTEMNEIAENVPSSVVRNFNDEIFWLTETAFRSPGKNIEFNKAFLEFQRGLKAVTKDSYNPYAEYTYAGLDTIMADIQPRLSTCGLILSQAIGATTVVTTVTHADSGQFIGSVTPIVADEFNKKMSPPQKYGSGSTYARRYALGILGITTTIDDDASGETTEKIKREATISKEDADAILADAAKIGKDRAFIDAAVAKAIGAGKSIYDLPVSRVDNMKKWLKAQQAAVKTDEEVV